MRWFPGAAITLLVLLGMTLQWAPLYSIEYAVHGLLSRLMPLNSQDEIVMIAIDDKTVSELGSHTPPRAVMSEAIRVISNSGAAVIAIDEVYSAPAAHPALDELIRVTSELALDKELIKQKDARKVYKAFKSIPKRADTDKMIARAMGVRARVVLPVFMTNLEEPAPKKVNRHALKMDASDEGSWSDRAIADIKKLSNPLFKRLNPIANSSGMDYPFNGLLSSAKALGHINVMPDSDGVVRGERLLWAHGGRLYPSLALRTAMRYLSVPMSKLKVSDSGVMMGAQRLPMDKAYSLAINYGGRLSSIYSFNDLITNSVDPEGLKGKVVLVGHNSSRTPRFHTPLGLNMSALEIRANVLDNIISARHIIRPDWGFGLECAVILYFGLIAAFIIPRMRPRSAGMVVLLSLLPIIITSAVLFLTLGLWVMVYSPAVVLVLGYAVVLGRAFIVFGNRTEMMEERADTNRKYGQELQNKGNLDVALERYMKCPPTDERTKEVLYSLALDYERKRMQNKAANVYERILEGGSFRDAHEKLAIFKAAGSASFVGSFGGGGGGMGAADGTIIADAGAMPTLGRYEISRELGRGAMGVVYLGRDPKINREVAIKTLLYGEIEADQLDEIKRRFFQEAEAAGKLSHPNILTIFDAGEEHDMAYLAMEVLDGVDLKEHCAPDTLQPMPVVLKQMADVAGALDYAHQNGVIHRDIKPANIMLLKDGTVKVTDFGIARVVESSKTQTGLVLGTPSYMSPEQVSGKKVDGRSDLFSLGSMMYELLTGSKAFTGDSITGIMYNITNGKYTPMDETGATLPPCVVEIVQGLLQKSLTKRYKNGAEAAAAINECLKKLA